MDPCRRTPMHRASVAGTSGQAVLHGSARREAMLAGELFSGSFPGLTLVPGTQLPDVHDLCSGIFQACQGVV